jgi:hypothetical protein
MNEDLIKRPPDEEFDTVMEVERNPTGAWMAIQEQASHIEQLERERDDFEIALDKTMSVLDTQTQILFQTRTNLESVQAKLAKAVEALNTAQVAIMENANDVVWRLWAENTVAGIRSALVELEKPNDIQK